MCKRLFVVVVVVVVKIPLSSVNTLCEVEGGTKLSCSQYTFMKYVKHVGVVSLLSDHTADCRSIIITEWAWVSPSDTLIVSTELYL